MLITRCCVLVHRNKSNLFTGIVNQNSALLAFGILLQGIGIGIDGLLVFNLDSLNQQEAFCCNKYRSVFNCNYLFTCEELVPAGCILCNFLHKVYTLSCYKTVSLVVGSLTHIDAA